MQERSNLFQDSKSKSKRGPGRPKGSKNKNLPMVTKELARCDSCKSTNTKKRRQLRPSLDCYGQDKKGLPYDQTHWNVRECLDCGCLFVEHWHSFKGEKLQD